MRINDDELAWQAVPPRLRRVRRLPSLRPSPMPDHRCVATAVAKVTSTLCTALRLPEGSAPIQRISESMHQLCEEVLAEARDRIVLLERQTRAQHVAIEQLQELVQSLIDKPK